MTDDPNIDEVPQVDSSQQSPRPALRSEQWRRRDPDLEPVRFSLREMMLGVTVVAAALAIGSQFRSAGIFGVMCVAVAYTLGTWFCATPAMRASYSLVWGVLMPFLFLAFDDLILGEQGLPAERWRKLTRFEWWAYLFALYEMLAMSVWVLHGRRLVWLESFLAGTFVCAIPVAGMAGILMGGYSLVLTQMPEFPRNPLPLVGWIPAAAAIAYYRGLIGAGKQALAGQADGIVFWWLLLGLIVGGVGPVVAGLLAFQLYSAPGV